MFVFLACRALASHAALSNLHPQSTDWHGEPKKLISSIAACHQLMWGMSGEAGGRRRRHFAEGGQYEGDRYASWSDEAWLCECRRFHWPQPSLSCGRLSATDQLVPCKLWCFFLFIPPSLICLALAGTAVSGRCGRAGRLARLVGAHRQEIVSCITQ